MGWFLGLTQNPRVGSLVAGPAGLFLGCALISLCSLTINGWGQASKQTKS